MFIFREESKELFKKDNELIGHFIEFMDVGVGVDVAEPSSHRVVNEEQVGELVPGPIVQYQCVFVFEPVWPNFHQASIFRTTTWASVQPDNRALSVCNMLVLVVPEEQVSIVLRCDFDVAREGDRSVSKARGIQQPQSESAYLPSMHLNEGGCRRTGQGMNEVVRRALLCN